LYVGRLKEIPGVFSQGESLEELEDNIRDAYRMMMSDEESSVPHGAQTKDVELEV
jgi:predicted RNase H-like HicB family nuclease